MQSKRRDFFPKLTFLIAQHIIIYQSAIRNPQSANPLIRQSVIRQSLGNRIFVFATNPSYRSSGFAGREESPDSTEQPTG